MRPVNDVRVVLSVLRLALSERGYAVSATGAQVWRVAPSGLAASGPVVEPATVGEAEMVTQLLGSGHLRLGRNRVYSDGAGERITLASVSVPKESVRLLHRLSALKPLPKTDGAS